MENTKHKKIFKNFAEYWHLVKILSEEQRVILTDSLSPFEQKSLKASFDKGGWQDLFMRNLCDHHLDEIKKNFDVDLLEIKASVISGQPYLINGDFWEFVIDYFEFFPWDYISYIFDGIITKPHNSEYVKLVHSGSK